MKTLLLLFLAGGAWGACTISGTRAKYGSAVCSQLKLTDTVGRMSKPVEFHTITWNKKDFENPKVPDGRLDALEKRVAELEEENRKLRIRAIWRR